MNLLGIGPFELMLILVIATIVLGPERMAQAGRTLGRLYSEYRLRWQKDVDEMTRELRRELTMLQEEMDEIRQSTETEIRSAQAALESAVNPDAEPENVEAASDSDKSIAAAPTIAASEASASEGDQTPLDPDASDRDDGVAAVDGAKDDSPPETAEPQLPSEEPSEEPSPEARTTESEEAPLDPDASDRDDGEATVGIAKDDSPSETVEPQLPSEEPSEEPSPEARITESEEAPLDPDVSDRDDGEATVGIAKDDSPPETVEPQLPSEEPSPEARTTEGGEAALDPDTSDREYGEAAVNIADEEGQPERLEPQAADAEPTEEPAARAQTAEANAIPQETGGSDDNTKANAEVSPAYTVEKPTETPLQGITSEDEVG